LAQAVRDIRRRIKAIRSTQQITRAMQMVAAAKLRKAQGRAVSARAYAAKLAEVLGRLTSDGAHAGHALLRVRPVRKACVLVVSADRGLAGSYNTNLFRRAEAILGEIRRQGAEMELLVVGRKGRDYFRRRGYAMAREELGVGDDALDKLARELAVRFIDRFSRGVVDEVVVIYSRFHSTIVQRPLETRLLPVSAPEVSGGAMMVGRGAGETSGQPQAEEDEREAQTGEGGDGHGAPDEIDGPAPAETHLRYVYEPNARAVYSLLLPKFVSNQLFQSFLEARASEHAARMTAMAGATENANDLIGRLTLEMHHARQASITQEIMELVSGAEALKEK
jgi:F-type H+-transporting ATPase subunit gamma